MIPKKIHYCWLSGEELPLQLKECINSWKRVMPEFEIICWDKGKFDIESVPFVSEACKVKKWAFASDYIRLHALYFEGGIYLDSDVFVRKTFTEFLPLDFFTSIEYHKEIVQKKQSSQMIDYKGRIVNPNKKIMGVPGIGLQAAIIGSVEGHPYLYDCIQWYKEKHFILPNKKYYDKVIAPTILAKIAEQYGFLYKDDKQELKNGMIIFPSETFAGDQSCETENSYAVHLCQGSWRPTEKIFPEVLKKMLKLFNQLKQAFS